jgi:aminodeoxyfutalosine synthase
MPGGGAEVFDESVFQELCPGKMNAGQWADVHRTAHRMGLKTNATMLYGHIEKPHHRIDHLERLRRLQDETGGFLSFIPLAFNPEHTELEHLGWTSGVDDLKTLAISRIYLDNFDHIKSYWITSSIGIAQLGLSFGSDDIHGTVREENITHMAGAKVPQILTVGDLKRLIVETGCEPHQRDSVYNILN